MDWNYKIKNDHQLKDEIFRITSKYYAIKNDSYPKGQEMVLDRLRILEEIVFKNKPIPGNQQAAGNLLPFLEFKGGPEFLETQDGKDIIEIFFYFSYKWKP